MIPIKAICEHYHLGEALQAPEVVSGGTMHALWRLTATNGVFAIKRFNQLNRQLLGDQQISVAQMQTLCKKLNTNQILTHQPKPHATGYELQWAGEHWAVYPWIEGHCLSLTEVTTEHAFKIGQTLAAIHQLKIVDCGIKQSQWQALSPERLDEYLQAGQMRQLQWFPKLTESAAQIVDWHYRIQPAVCQLSKNKVISHRDPHCLNVIWNSAEEPTLIDWELSGFIAPQLEVFIAAMNWSYLNNAINVSLFTAVIKGYGENVALDLDCLRDGYCGYLLDWLSFNCRRSIADPMQEAVSTAEIHYVLDVLHFLYSEAGAAAFFKADIQD